MRVAVGAVERSRALAAALSGRVDVLDRLARCEQEVGAGRDAVVLWRAVDDRLLALDERLTALDRRLAVLDRRLSALARRLAGLRVEGPL